MKAPLRVAGASFAISMVLAALIGTNAVMVAAILCLLCFAVSLAVPALRKIRIVPLIFLCATIAFSLFGARYLWVWQPLDRFDGRVVETTVRVTGLPATEKGALIVRVDEKAGALPEGTKIAVWNDKTLPALYDTLKVRVRLRALTAERTFYAADGVFLTGSLSSAEIVPGDPPPWYAVFPRLRERLTETVTAHLYGEPEALITAVCLGDKSGLSPRTVSDFRCAGLSHLLCVSGLHVSALAFLLGVLFRFLPKKPRTLLLLLGVWGFVLLTGASVSTVRAGVFFTVATTGSWLRARSDELSSLGLAFILLCLADPFCIYDRGMQLSFGACFGLATVTPALRRAVGTEKRTGLVRRVLDSLCITLGAVLPICPIMALSFGEVYLLSPLSNLLAVFPCTVMLALGCLSMATGCIAFLEPLTRFLAALAGLLARLLMFIARGIAAIPVASVPVTDRWVMVWMFGALAVLYLAVRWKGKAGWSRGVCVAALALAAGLLTRTLLERNTLRMTVPSSRGTAVCLTYNGRHAVLLLDGSADTANRTISALREQGSRRLDAVVLCDTPSEVGPLLTDALSAGETVIADGTVTLWDRLILRKAGEGWWELTFGDSRVLLAGEAADAYALEDTAVDLLVAGNTFPAHYQRLSVGRTLLDCDEDLATRLALSPATAQMGIRLLEGGSCTVRFSADGTLNDF